MLPLQASALQNLEILSYYGEDRTFLAAGLFYGKKSLENTVNQIRERVYPRGYLHIVLKLRIKTGFRV